MKTSGAQCIVNVRFDKISCFLGSTIILVISALCGIKVMRKLSAVHVVVFNTSRSVIVWAFSLAFSWQAFQALQIVGFLFIVLGVMVFNDILIGKISCTRYILNELCNMNIYYWFLGPLIRKYIINQKKSVSVSSDPESGSSKKPNIMPTVELKSVIKVNEK